MHRVAIFACTMAFAAPAFAQTSAADMAAARALGTEGIKLANHGKCVEAIDRLERAERLYHAPTTLGRLGECHVEIGKLVQGTEELRRVVREPLASDAPKAFVQAHTRAEKALTAAQGRIPYVRIVVNAPSGAKPELVIDGESVSSAAIGTEWPVDPGEHTFEATAPGYTKASNKLRVKEADKKEVTLTIDVDPNAPKTPPPPPPPTQTATPAPTLTPTPTPPPPSPPSRVPAYIAFGVGAAGLAVGTVGGLVFLNKKSDLEKACPDKKCTSDNSGTLDSTKTWGTITTIGFIVGGAGVAAGFVLLLLPGTGSVTTGSAVTPVVGPSYAGVSGRF
jgi:hypothetical protein